MTWPVHPAADVFAMLSDSELKALVDDIRANGLTEPVWLWDDPKRGTVLLDGRNRVRACEAAGVQVRTQQFQGDGLAALNFVISQNVRRRHLNAGQLAAVAADLEPMFAAEAKNRQGTRTDLNNISADRREGPRPRELKASEQAAKQVGTSGRSVERFKRVADADPDLAAKVKAGTVAVNRADRIIRDRKAKAEHTIRARQELDVIAAGTTVDVRTGDFRKVLADLTGVDAIITDPPYPAEYLHLLADLAAWSDKVLTEDGIMAILIGQTHLPDVYRLLDGHRSYRWTMCLQTPGGGYVSHPRKVQSNWKPVLVYGGGPRFGDVLSSEGTDADAKDRHHWGQDYSAFHTLVQRLTLPGQTVVDPFMGSGTTLAAAKAQGRHAVGCDVDANAVATAQKLLA